MLRVKLLSENMYSIWLNGALIGRFGMMKIKRNNGWGYEAVGENGETLHRWAARPMVGTKISWHKLDEVLIDSAERILRFFLEGPPAPLMELWGVISLVRGFC
jgi:hypothetical protein